MFSSIAFFHLVQGHRDPVLALNTELDSHPDLSNALLVLPEAFNLGRPYADHGSPTIHRDEILKTLVQIWQTRKISFVVGLLQPAVAGSKPRNSAYFVGGEKPRLMCHKETADGADYEACPIEPDQENPLFLVDTAIVAVICRDVSCSGRCDRLAETAVTANRACNIVCIPAAMYEENNWFGGAVPGNRLPFLQQPYGDKCHVALANSDRSAGQGSFITDAAGVVRIRLTGAERQKNQIAVFAIG